MFPSLNNSIGLAVDQKTEQSVLKVISKSATLGVNDNIVHVTGFSSAVTITLPPVGDCAGRVFAITVLEDSDTNNITVQDQDDSIQWDDQVIDNSDGGCLLLWCDGSKFWVLSAELS